MRAISGAGWGAEPPGGLVLWAWSWLSWCFCPDGYGLPSSDSFRGYSEALSETDRHDFQEAIDVAMARMQRLAAFMNGFAAVVRLPQPDLRPCDLRQLVDEILLLLRPDLERRRIRGSP